MKRNVDTMNPPGTYSSLPYNFPQRQMAVGSTPIRTVILCVVAVVLLCASPALATLGDYQAAVTNTASIISYYTFENSNANDVVGANHGTLMGTTAFEAGAGGIGKGLLLDGTGRVNLGVVPDFAFEDTTGSLEAWIQAGNLGGANVTIFANRDGATRYSVHLNSDKAAIGMWNGSAYYPTVPIPNASTTWHHLAVVFDNGNFNVYWDGAPAGSTYRILGYTDTSKATQLGSASPSGMTEGFVGVLDEVAFYGDALTAETIQAHYQAFFAGSPPVIAAQPKGGTYLPGVPLTLSVKATGPNLAYQWYKGTTALAGKTDATLSFASLASGDGGTYSVTVTNVAGVVPSAQATITVSSSLPLPLSRYQAAISNETSLLSYYTFDRLVPEDVFGPNEGTLVGTAGFDDGIGNGAGKGLLLDGAGHVSLGYVSDFDFPSGSGTVEGWMRADWDDASGYPCMFANRDGATVWSLHLSADKKTLTSYNGSTSLACAVPGGSAGTNWHHVAVVYDAGTATYYYDGAFVATQDQTFGVGPASVQFGSSASLATAEGWNGMLDEVALYSTALPAASILAHYNAFYQGNPPVITGQPTGGYFLIGEPQQMTVTATGAGLTYQWYKDGAMIPDGTTATIGTTSLTAQHAGAYYVKVSNNDGSTNSATVTVSVGNNMARYQATVLAEGSLISYYKFDAGDGRDEKNAHPGTVANTVAFEAGPGGGTNQSLKLDGTGHIDLGTVAESDFASGGTVEGWVRPDWVAPAAYDPCIFADRDGGSVWSIHMERWKGVIGNWNGQRFQTLGFSGSSGWHHYAVTFGGGKVAMYWDGKPMGTNVQSIEFSSGKTTQIGSGSPVTTSEGWMGGLDEVAFYGTALGAETIWSHFLAMVGPDVAPKLSYSLTGKQLTISWPSGVSGYTLESSENLSNPTWVAVPGVVNNQVTVDASSGMKFYRLRK